MKRRLFAESRIIHKLDRAAGGLYDAVTESAAGRGLTSYDAEEKDASRSLIASKVSGLFARINMRKLRLVFSREAENSTLVKLFNGFLSRLASSSVRQYGLFLFAFGFYGMLVYFLSHYANFISIDPLPASYLAVEVFITVVSLPMLTVKRTAADAICHSRIANLLLFDLLGLRRESLAEYGKYGKRIAFSFVAGIVLGLLTAFIPPLRIINAILVFFGCTVVVFSPESGLIITVLLLPYISTASLGYILMYVTVCFLIKVLRGKRTLGFDLLDCGVLTFAAVVLLGGAFSLDPSSSISYAVKMTFYLFSYILTVNLIRSSKWLKRIKSAVIISCVLAALGGLAQAAADASPNFVSEKITAAGGVTSFFTSREALSEFLALGVFFIISEILQNTHKIRKVFFFVLSTAVLVCIWFADFTPLILSCMIAAVLFFLIYSHRTLIFLLGCAIVIPAVQSLLPLGLYTGWKHVIDGVAAHAAAKAPLTAAGAAMASDYLFSGIGLGGFRTVFSQYANENISYAAVGPNLYLQIVIDVGIFGLIVFLCVVLLFAQHSFSLFAARGGGKKTLDTAAGLAGITALLICGFADYIWYEEKLFLCFWIIMGIAAAASNITVESERGADRFVDLN